MRLNKVFSIILSLFIANKEVEILFFFAFERLLLEEK